jgi:hypothetical protein
VMSVNRIQIKAKVGDKNVTIPLGQSFDEVGREDLVKTLELVEQQDAINIIRDYETTKYFYGNSGGPIHPNEYNIFYEFNFITTGDTYTPDFNPQGFKDYEIYRLKKSFTKSFFKFDFYDSPLQEDQNIMFTMTMPLTNCKKEKDVQVIKLEDALEYWSQKSQGIQLPVYDIYWPKVQLGPSKGNNEGYYIQWYKNRDLYSGDTFYMSCKFYNAKTGEVVKMLNKPSWNQSPVIDNPESSDWYYYWVKLSINNNETPKYVYTVREFDNNVAGGEKGMDDDPPSAQIKFYEYKTPTY